MINTKEKETVGLAQVVYGLGCLVGGGAILDFDPPPLPFTSTPYAPNQAFKRPKRKEKEIK